MTESRFLEALLVRQADGELKNWNAYDFWQKILLSSRPLKKFHTRITIQQTFHKMRRRKTDYIKGLQAFKLRNINMDRQKRISTRQELFL